MKTTSTCSLKVVLYLTLFLKFGNKEQQLKNIMNFKKLFSIFKNQKLFFNHMSNRL